MMWRKLIPIQRGLIQNVLKLKVRNISTTNLLRTSHYEVLGVQKDATQAEIKNAFFELSKIYHPDRIAATDENLAKFRAITTAYEVLGNEHSRKLYDTGLIPQDGHIETSTDAYMKDPIIRFYKERQDREKERDFQSSEAWTTEYYQQERKKVFQKDELFRETYKKQEDYNYYPSMTFALAFTAFVAVIFKMDYENHPFQLKVQRVMNYFK
ncbi:hypothetical protein RUM44_004959 [Polyplax serrata]|uniref:J domain-containing protein n=1 Tax=Polyplax serrata TaxID=468196 RepID=A0ABR1AY23_POLSC